MIGTAKLVCAEELFCEEDDAGEEVPLTGSRSMSICSLMVELDSFDNRRRSSGGRLRGWMSASFLLRREDDRGSVACRESLGCRGDANEFSVSRGSRCEAGRGVFFEGVLVCEPLIDLVGDRDSECLRA